MGNEMKNMTRKQLKKALIQNRYILARLRSDNSQQGLNSQVSKIKAALRFPIDNTETVYISYEPCSFMDYISFKIPFL